MTNVIRVLHLEDSPQDAELIHDRLTTGGVPAEVTVVDSRESFEAAVTAERFDIIVCDYNIPGYSGLTAVEHVRKKGLRTPVVVVSGTTGEDAAVHCLHVGATDYLLKDRLDRLAPAVRRALDEAEVLRKRNEAEAALRESEERLRLSQRAAGWGVFDFDYATQRNYWSPELEALYGLQPGEFGGTFESWVARVHPDDVALVDHQLKATFETGDYSGEFRIVWPDGSIRWMLARASLYRDERGQPRRLLGVNVDITERKQLELQLRQAQKMESVGQLAGGIAHDFNNLLTVINGTAELALEQDPASQVREDLEAIRDAGERAAALTRQLLAFSRRQILQPKVLDLNTVIGNLKGMLGRLLGEDVELVFIPAPDLGRVLVDAGQMEQVITNLAVNARDAMPRGGRLTIETANVTLDGDYSREQGTPPAPGPYVMVTVSDTGSGMDAATRTRIFEPFFTTKEAGKGTGLGLSTAYGIVKQSGGFISVYSEIGHGTAFKIYLPHATRPAAVESLPPTTTDTHGHETILVVEDVGGLRQLAKRVLERAGYTVLTAADGEEALQLLAQDGVTIDLAILDIVMPSLGGRALHERLAALNYSFKVLYMSGYTDDVIVRHGVLKQGTPFLSKPFAAAELTRKVREVLDS